jgi:DNA polymerase V
MLYYTSIPAGFPSPAADYLDDAIDLNQLLIKSPAATYFVIADGDSMIDALIPDKGLLVVDRSAEAESEDIIVGVISGQFTIKRLLITPEGVKLMPANSKYEPIVVTEEMEFQVWGVVTSIIIDIKKVKYVRAH